jgi:hypothetical protein
MCNPQLSKYWRNIAHRKFGNFADVFFFIRRSSPISGEKIAMSVVLAQHNAKKRIGKAGK